MSIISMSFMSIIFKRRRRRSKTKRKQTKSNRRKDDTTRVPLLLPYLHQSIMEEIFHKLPYNALARSKLASKEWNSIISCPKFMNDHYNYRHSIEGNNLILCDYHDNLYTSSCSNLVKDQPLTPLAGPIPKRNGSIWRDDNWRIVGSYNGLVALSSDENLILLNSLTGKYTLVKSEIHTSSFNYEDEFRLLFGLCYDEGNNEYSVVVGEQASSPVSISNFNDDLYFEMFWGFLYNFNDGCERDLVARSVFDDVRLLDDKLLKGEIGKVIRGIPHWVVQFYDFVDPVVKTGIFYFDLKGETFRQMTCPKGDDNKRVIGLAGMDDENQLGCVLHDVVRSSLEVWWMKVYGESESWTNLFTIPYLNNVTSDLGSSSYMDVLGFMASGDLLLHLNKGGLWIYNVYKGNWRKVKFEDGFFNFVVTYQPKLVSPPESRPSDSQLEKQ